MKLKFMIIFTNTSSPFITIIFISTFNKLSFMKIMTTTSWSPNFTIVTLFTYGLSIRRMNRSTSTEFHVTKSIFTIFICFIRLLNIVYVTFIFLFLFVCILILSLIATVIYIVRIVIAHLLLKHILSLILLRIILRIIIKFYFLLLSFRMKKCTILSLTTICSEFTF